MFPSNARIAMIALGLAAALFAAPLESEGGLCDWLCPSSWCAPRTSVTTYSIPYSACSPCSPCASPCAAPYSVGRVSLMPVAQACYSPVSQTCYYVPQTTYRWSYSRISWTRFRPVTAVDPCTGCPTTAYHPVTRRTLLPWLHREPVMSYRLVCSPTCATSYSAVCAPSATTLSDPCCPAPVTTVPGAITSTPGVDPGYAPPTFKTEQGAGPAGPSFEGTQQPHLDLRPSPDVNTNPTSMEQPRLIMPSYSKTAVRPVRHASYLRMIDAPPSAGTATPVGLDVSGWRASQD